MEPPGLVIFDCDGVLVETEAIDVRVGRRILAQLGWQLSDAEFVRRFVGGTRAQFTSHVEVFLGHPLDPSWRDAYDAWYEAAYEEELEPVPGIEQALDALTLPVCVATNGPEEKARRNLARTGLLERFDSQIYSADDVREGKPSPDLFLHVARTLNVSPDRCVVVEDSRYGVQAAGAAGMRVFAYGGGVTPSDWLSGRHTTVFSNMAQLPSLLNAASIQRRFG